MSGTSESVSKCNTMSDNTVSASKCNINKWMRCTIFSLWPQEAATRLKFSVRARRCNHLPFFSKKWTIANFHFEHATWRRGAYGGYEATSYSPVAKLDHLLTLEPDLPVHLKAWVEGRVNKTVISLNLGDLLRRIQKEAFFVHPDTTTTTSGKEGGSGSKSLVKRFQRFIKKKRDSFHNTSNTSGKKGGAGSKSLLRRVQHFIKKKKDKLRSRQSRVKANKTSATNCKKGSQTSPISCKKKSQSIGPSSSSSSSQSNQSSISPMQSQESQPAHQPPLPAPQWLWRGPLVHPHSVVYESIDDPLPTQHDYYEWSSMEVLVVFSCVVRLMGMVWAGLTAMASIF